MDARRFDHLTKLLAAVRSRRGLLRWLLAFLLSGPLAWQPAANVAADGRRKRRKKAHKHGRPRRHGTRKEGKCKAKSRARICAGKCGNIKNKQTCKKRVDCGPCACDPPCPICQTCDEATATCAPDQEQFGEPCGEPGQVCQRDGRCACDTSSCPACATCQEDGACTLPCDGNGCCDGLSCQPGTVDDACGSGGTSCGVCSGQEQCQNGQCVCVTACAGKVCGADGCGGQCDPGCGPNATCSSDGTACACDFTSCEGACCAENQRCCDEQCVSGECCTNAECAQPAQPICRDHFCSPCVGDDECGAGRVCCDGQCLRGVCCQAQDCPQEICQTRECLGNACDYTPVFGEPGPRCATLCCRDTQGAPQCCAAGSQVCTATGLCSCRDKQDCATDEVCCNGRCEAPIWTNQTLFGSGPGNGSSQFDQPVGLAIAADERTAWIVDQLNHRVAIWTRQQDGSWANQTTFGGSGSGPTQFEFPYGVAVSDDGQTAWVGDQGHDRVSVWTRQQDGSWAHLTNFGSGPGSGPDQFDRPTGVAATGDGQRVWVSDTGNDRVSVWTRSGNTWVNQTTFGTTGDGPGQFQDPVGLTASADGQTVWVVDRVHTGVAVWTRQANDEWTFQSHFGSFGSGPSQFRGPADVAASQDGQTVWVSDGNNRISIWTGQPTGSWAPLTTFGSTGSGPNQLAGPSGIDVSGDDKTVWVAEVINNRVTIWSLNGCPAT